MISKEDQIMMETLYWWGIPTLDFKRRSDHDGDSLLVGYTNSI